MIPGYDIYFGDSTIETKKYFLENVKKIAEIAEREGDVYKRQGVLIVIYCVGGEGCDFLRKKVCIIRNLDSFFYNL